MGNIFMKYKKYKSMSKDEKQSIILFYKNHSNKQTREHFNITDNDIVNILKEFKVDRHTKRDNLIFTCSETQGGLGFASKEHREKVHKTCLEKYNDPNYNNMEKNWSTKICSFGSKENYINYWKEKTKNTLISKYGSIDQAYDKIFDSVRNTLFDKYGVYNISQSQHIASKKSKKFILDNGLTLDSSWEVCVYNYALNHNLKIERNIPIHYNYPNNDHLTFIDFRIDGYLIEIKAPHLLNGCFDYALKISSKDKIDLYKKHNVNIITNNDYLNSNLNIINISMFQQNIDWNKIKQLLI